MADEKYDLIALKIASKLKTALELVRATPSSAYKKWVASTEYDDWAVFLKSVNQKEKDFGGCLLVTGTTGPGHPGPFGTAKRKPRYLIRFAVPYGDRSKVEEEQEAQLYRQQVQTTVAAVLDQNHSWDGLCNDSHSSDIQPYRGASPNLRVRDVYCSVWYYYRIP
jgi:hypothetical protein